MKALVRWRLMELLKSEERILATYRTQNAHVVSYWRWLLSTSP